MKRPAVAAAVSLVLLCVAIVPVHGQTRPAGSAAVNLRQIGQAIHMYASDHKGYVPPDLGKLAKYVRESGLDVFVSPRRMTQIPPEVRAKPEASAEWFATQCDYVLTVPPGTRISRLRDPAQFPIVVEKPTNGGGVIAILYADGHVVEYADRNVAEPAGAPAASSPAPMAAAPPSTRRAQAKGPGAKLPADLPGALTGSWRLTQGVDATYAFKADGTFTLTFLASGQASGTWKLDGNRLIMTNTATSTPYTVVGEQEDAEIVGVTDNALALRTTNRKGADEILVFEKIVPFASGKHDNPKIIGTWQADDMLLVVAESGLFVMSGGMRTSKGQWSQQGNSLTILFERPSTVPGNRRRVDPEPRSGEASLTIDLVNDTTLVLTGQVLGRPDHMPATFLRVK